MQNKISMVALAVFMALGSGVVVAAADEFSNENQVVTTSVTYTGDADTVAVIDTRTENPVEGTMWHGLDVFGGGSFTLSGYRDFNINNGENWTYGIYTPYAGKVAVDVERDINVTARSTALHAMQDSSISLTAGNDVTIHSNGNAIFAQQTTDISVTAERGSVNLISSGMTVGTGYVSGEYTAEITVKAAEKIIVKNLTEDGVAISADYKDQEFGGSFTFEAPKGMEVTGNVSTIRGKVTFADNTKDIVVHGGSYVHFGELHGKELNFYFDDFADGTSTLSVENDQTEVINATVGAEGMDRMSKEQAEKALREMYATGTRSGYGTTTTITVDKDVTTVTGSDITEMTNDLAVTSLVAWRNEITTLNDRMSTLRTSPSTLGAWARYNGGEYQYNARCMKHEFNTIEVGADAKVSDNWIVGASFAYTKGDGDFVQGETETDTYSGAFYALWTHEKGSFVDLVMKAGRMENDFDFHNLTGGGYDNGTLEHTGFIMGIETGHRFALPMNAFVEPQLQLTYNRLSSVSETTTARHVELDAMDSLVGRVGIMAGIECPNDRGSAYVKVSALRDFRGDIDGSYASVKGGDPWSISQELDDNWFEYAIGGNFKLSDNAYLFADVAKSAGGEIDLDWRANVGAKLFF